MADATADWKAALTVMCDAFIAGDNPRGEELFTFALDAGAPWDVATATAAQALSARHASSGSVLPATYPAPA
jgi:hypothetical protein